MKKGHKKSRHLRLSTLVVIAIVAALISFELIKLVNQNSSRDSSNPLINISELPEQFMKNYLDSYAEMAKIDNRENILIVTSSTKLENIFGAEKVVEAANHQYFLQYASEEKKNLAFQQISGEPNLRVIENSRYELFDDDEEESNYNSWGIEKMGLDHAKELLENYPDKQNVTVAIVDTGLDVDLFTEKYPNKLAGTYNVLSETSEMSDEAGHGTHVAGTIAEGTPDNVSIIPVKISTNNNMFTTDILAAIDYITYYEVADVINMSFGGYLYEEPEYLAIEAAKEKNIISVAAAGNDSTSSNSFPSSFDNTISISAVDSDLRFTEFSNYGNMVTFTAPGLDILSLNGVKSGTSMATPHAVAAVAIAKSFNKNFNFDDTIEFLKTRATDLGPKGRDDRFGYGFIDFNGAVLCNDNSSSCDEFAILEKNVESGIEIAEVILTPYNYGSLTNILATKLKIFSTNGSYITKSLGDFGIDIEINGYDPYASGEQTISVNYNNFTTSFTVENPDNYESGWKYTTVYNYETYTYDQIYLTEYRDHGQDIKTLYLPEEIDNYQVTGNYSGCLFSGPSEWIECDYPSSKDVLYYENLIMPRNYKNVNGAFNGSFSDKGKFQNLYYIHSLADEVTVIGGTFSSLKNLVEINANIVFEAANYMDMEGNEWVGYAENVFSGDESLNKVTLSEKNPVIPKSTFSDCKSLKTINLPDSIKEIRENAFYNAGITTLELGDNLEKIGNQAFARSNLETIVIPASVTEIGSEAFADAALESLSVSPDNPVFDSRNDSNSIIETDNNKLIVGTHTTVIPETVKIIGEKAFYNSSRLEEIIIPEGVEKIESSAFEYCSFLTKVTLPRTLTSFEDNSFKESGMSTPSRTVFWIYEDTYAKDRVFEFDYPYVLIGESEPTLIIDASFESIPENRVLYAFDTFTPDNFIIKIYYYDEETGKASLEPEVITNYDVEYRGTGSEDYDSLIGGYNIVTFIFDTETGYHNLKIDLALSAELLTPEYELPTDISAYVGQFLSEIELPEGFSWVDKDEIISETKTEYLAQFTPEDTLNYQPINNISIPINVIVGNSFSELFPDENLRACIIENYNAENNTNYTEETINLEEIFEITQLNCSPSTEEEAIRDARGIEKLTKLESLNLSGNEIEKINLANNKKLESLNLRFNNIKNLDITNNPELSEFFIDESKLEMGEEVIVKTPAYMEVFCPENDEGECVVIMDISGLDFLNGAEFYFDDQNVSYDSETGIVKWATGGATSLKINLNLNPFAETISYTIYGFPRDIIVSLFLDGEAYETGFKFGYTYTNSKVDINSLADLVSRMYGLSGYVLEDTIINQTNEYTVGKENVNINFYFKNIRKKDNEPGDEPVDEPVDEPNEELENGGDAEEGNGDSESETATNSPKTPRTGSPMTKEHELNTSSISILASSLAVFVIVLVYVGKNHLKK